MARALASDLLGGVVQQDADDATTIFTITHRQDRESVETEEASDAYKDVYLAAIRPFLMGARQVSLYEMREAGLEGSSRTARTEPRPPPGHAE